MCSDSKICSQKISDDTLSCSKSMLSIHEKKLKKYHDSLQMAKSRQHRRGVGVWTMHGNFCSHFWGEFLCYKHH